MIKPGLITLRIRRGLSCGKPKAEAADRAQNPTTPAGADRQCAAKLPTGRAQQQASADRIAADRISADRISADRVVAARPVADGDSTNRSPTERRTRSESAGSRSAQKSSPANHAKKGLEFLSLQAPDSVYFMGICGAAMAPLAVFLKEQGFSVSGCDQNIYPPMSSLLEENAVPVQKTPALDSSVRLAIIGNAVRRDFPALQDIENLNIPYTSLPEFLEEGFLKDKKNIVVAGTHGKTTVTALTASAARAAGMDPGFFIGGRPRDFRSSFHLTDSQWFVIEGDEYDTAFFAKHPKFFHYHPFVLLLTGLEFDHADIYRNFDEIATAFAKTAAEVPPDGLIVAPAEDRGAQEVLRRAKIRARLVTYGENQGDFQLKDWTAEGMKSRFVCIDRSDPKGRQVSKISLNLSGRHNSLNALAVFAALKSLGRPVPKILSAFSSFKGILRRMEIIEETDKLLLIRDFAHHPSAVKKTIEAVKQSFPRRRLIAVFEPRSFTSCLNIFQKDYAEALSAADRAAILRPFRKAVKGREPLSLTELSCDIQARTGKKPLIGESQEELSRSLIQTLQPGDAALLMSNGDLDRLIQLLKKRAKSPENKPIF